MDIDIPPPLRVLSVDKDSVTGPRKQGLATYPQYQVPFELSRYPSDDEAKMIRKLWNDPGFNVNQHLQASLEVNGNHLIFKNTTIEAIRDLHAATVGAILAAVNADTAESARRDKAAAEALDAHRDHVAAVAATIKFE